MKVLSVVMAAAALSVATPLHAASIVDRDFGYGADRFSLVQTNGMIDVRLVGGAREFVPGRPDLPRLTERVDLPDGMHVTAIEVISAEGAVLGASVRVPPAIRLTPGLQTVERTTPDPAVYGRAGFQPEQLVTLEYQGSLRGRNVAMLGVRPARWDPVTGRLERLARLRVRLTLEPSEEPGVVRRERIVREWEDELPSGVPTRALAAALTSVSPTGRQAQPYKPTQLPSVLGSPVAYLIITNDELAPAFQRLADWKTQTGIPAVVRTLSFIQQQYLFGVDDADRVRQFIRDAYARWGTKWVLLGGDTEVIPTRLAYTTFYGGEHIATDLYFSCLDGNWNADGDSTYGEGYQTPSIPGDDCDLLPEVYVGRAPVTTVAQVDQFIDKTFQYTRTPTGDYENRLLFFAEVLFPQDWSPGMATSLDGAETIEEVLPYLDAQPQLGYCRLYENHLDARWKPGALQETRARVLDSLDVGFNVAVHVGHGFRNVMSVGDATMNNADVSALTNGNRLINLYAANCTSNAIDFPCIGEAFLHAANGGAVTNIGSTRFDFPTAGRSFQHEYFRLVFDDSVTAIGEAQAKQKLPFIAFSTYDGVNRWTEMTLLLLGDPELRVWTERPKTMTVTHPASLLASDTTFTVNVKVGATPLPNATVTAWKVNDEYRVAQTDASGNAVLDFRPDSAGTCALTVTAFNCRPDVSNIPVTSASQPLLVERAPVIDDDGVGGSLGNNNLIPESGEVVDIRIPVRNNGSATAPSVTGTLTTTDPQVTVLNGSNSYGSISSGVVAVGSGWFRFSTIYTVADQREVPFTLTLRDGNNKRYVESLRITLRAPELRHFSHTVSEVSGGNGNGRPDLGETVNYTVRLRNLGTGVANSITAVLRNYDGKALITDSTAVYGDIQPLAEVAGDKFTFTVNATSPAFELRVSNQYGLIYVQKIDVTYPGTPAALALKGAASTITLTWLHNSESDLAGYNIYRSTAAGGPYVLVNLVPTDRTSYYLDENLTSLTRYYYKVAAVDSSGNESDQTTSASASTNPPLHSIFPIATGRNTPASVAVARTTVPNQMDFFTGSDVLYAWHPDGSGLVDADGSSTTSGDFTTLGTYYAAGPSIGDLDGGGLEVVATTWDSKSVYAFNLQGQIKPGWPLVTSNPMWSAAAIGDLDGDGSKEVAFASNGLQFYVVRANGTEWMDGDGNPSTVGVFKLLGSSLNYSTPALAPLEGGNQLDIVVGAFNGVVHAWRPNGTNLPGFPKTLGGQITGSIAIGYLDGPGDTSPEIVLNTFATKESLWVLQTNGSVRPGFPVYVRTGGTSKQPSPALADINSDGYLDIVIASTNGHLYVFDRNGVLNPNFADVSYSALLNSSSESSPVVADINGDGVPDIVMGDENGQLNAISGTGAQLAGFPIQLGGEVRGTPALCDCDGDGLTEIAVTGWDTNLYVWDYNFPFSPGGIPPWPQFHHDAMRTGFASGPTLVDVPPGPGNPTAIEFGLPAPNPASRSTRIAFAVPAEHAGDNYEVAVFDLGGRRVVTLASGQAAAGRYTTQWDLRGADGAPVTGGVYFLRFALGREHQSRKLIVMP